MKRLLTVLMAASMCGVICTGRAFAAESQAETQRITKNERLFDFLQKEYGLMLAKQKDRVSRSLLAISISRVPKADVTARLLEMTRRETDPLVRAVAWECLLSRTKMMGADSYRQMMESTGVLIDADVLRGELRVAALNLLAISQPEKRTKEMFARIFSRTDSRMPHDDAVIAAMGRTLAAWKSPDVVDWLIGRMQSVDDVWRADRVLRAAGAGVKGEDNKYDQGAQKAMRDVSDRYTTWWQQEKDNWKETKVSLEDSKWKTLPPHFVPAVEDYASVDPDDKKWKKDLELRPPNLKSFDVGFVVDVTGSMDPALAWLHTDIKRLMNCIGLVCLEPRIGITFYRDHGDEFIARTTPLTGRVDVLVRALENMTCAGGGDIPEAVLEGLTDSAAKNPWVAQASGKKVWVLVADAPGHPENQKECEELVRAAAEKGFHLYAVKLQGPHAAPDQSGLDALAKIGNGVSMDASGAELMNARPRKLPSEAGAGNYRGYSGGLGSSGNIPVGRRVLSAVLVDAINPQFADRVEPMSAVLWELLSESGTEKGEVFGPTVKTTNMGQPEPKMPKKGPQDR